MPNVTDNGNSVPLRKWIEEIKRLEREREDQVRALLEASGTAKPNKPNRLPHIRSGM